MKLLFIMVALIGANSAFSNSMSIGTFTDYPIGSGIEAKLRLEQSPVDLKLKWGTLTPGFVRAGTQLLIDTNRVSAQEAIVFDNAYEEGLQFEIAIGTSLDSFGDQFFIDFGYGLIQGDGGLSDKTARSIMGNRQDDIINLPAGLTNRQLKIGLKSEIHFLQATFGALFPLTRSIDFRAEFNLSHSIRNKMTAEFADQCIKSTFSEEMNRRQQDLLRANPMIPTITIGVSYGIGEDPTAQSRKSPIITSNL